MAAPKQEQEPARRFTEQEIAELMLPPAPESERLPVEEPLIVTIPPPPLPESDEAALARLTDAGLVKAEGQADMPPTPTPKSKLLRIVELDGVERTIVVDGELGGWLSVETRAARKDAPWILDAVASRVGVMSIASLSIEDVDEPGAA